MKSVSLLFVFGCGDQKLTTLTTEPKVYYQQEVVIHE